MLIENVIRGADPELFLQVVETGVPRTSIGLIGGTKHEPRQLGDGFALQEDNVTVEFNIPPVDNKELFVKHTHFMLSVINHEVAEKGLQILISPSCEFTFEDLDNPQAQELGCEPDYNAWTMKRNPRPRAPALMRSAGGHLHIGYDNPSEEVSTVIIRAHDLFCSVPALLYDKDKERRSIYGKAGACRYKKYGVEYRTPSNFWLKTKELTEWFYVQSEKAINFINNGGVIQVEDEEIIQHCINSSDDSFINYFNNKYAIL